MNRTRVCAHNNAAWCDYVCRSQGIRTRFTPGFWTALSPAPEFYPNMVTLAPRPIGAAQRVEGSVKDSFACLELRAAGFEVLFEATWLWRGDPEPAPGDDEDVHEFSAGSARLMANLGAGVVGLTNLVGTRDPQVIDGLCAGPAERWPGLPLVTYAYGEERDGWRAAGFEPVGELRVWVPAVPAGVRRPGAG